MQHFVNLNGPLHMTTTVEMLVVGAGFAGVYQLYKARQAGMTVKVLEAGDGVGGTWYWNRYPGARCDVESLDYSYSFSRELEAEWVWSERYAPQSEILRYINHVVDRFSLRNDILLNTRVTTAHYDDARALWCVVTADGQSFEATLLVMATEPPRESWRLVGLSQATTMEV